MCLVKWSAGLHCCCCCCCCCCNQTECRGKAAAITDPICNVVTGGARARSGRGNSRRVCSNALGLMSPMCEHLSSTVMGEKEINSRCLIKMWDGSDTMIKRNFSLSRSVMVGKEMAAVFDKNAISVPIFFVSFLRNLTGLGNMADGLVFLIAPKAPMWRSYLSPSLCLKVDNGQEIDLPQWG